MVRPIQAYVQEALASKCFQQNSLESCKFALLPIHNQRPRAVKHTVCSTAVVSACTVLDVTLPQRQHLHLPADFTTDCTHLENAREEPSCDSQSCTAAACCMRLLALLAMRRAAAPVRALTRLLTQPAFLGYTSAALIIGRCVDHACSCRHHGCSA